jgi:hypothetical protein
MHDASRKWLALALFAFALVVRRAVASTPHTFLTFAAIRELARGAGFAEEVLDVAAAIAMAESGGDVQNDRGDSGTSIGLWQVHMPAWPQFSRAMLLTAKGNAQAAYEIWTRAGGFHPWSSYHLDRQGREVGDGNGWYREFLP